MTGRQSIGGLGLDWHSGSLLTRFTGMDMMDLDIVWQQKAPLEYVYPAHAPKGQPSFDGHVFVQHSNVRWD